MTLAEMQDAKTVELPYEVARVLVERRILTSEGFERARRLHRETADPLLAILVKLGLVAERDLAEALAVRLELPIARPEDLPSEPVFEGALSPTFLKTHRILPFGDSPEGVSLAMADPLDGFATDAVRLALRRPVVRYVAVPADIELALERLYSPDRSELAHVVDGVEESDLEHTDEDTERLKDIASEAPVIRLVNLIITRAVEARASDVHIEPFQNRLRVRYRVDGVLREVEPPPLQFKAAVVSRIKIMAKLDVAEQRLPQDGRIRLAVRGRDVDLRVSIMPTMHGESVVIRILDKSSMVFEFDTLGFEPDTLQRYLRLLEVPNGIILITGPTGSGKTTTLYTSLLHVNADDKKIITVEDPIEYELEGVNQMQVRPQIGLTFASILRSVLRHDPEIVLIGEIRDLETAEIAAQASLTGHLVLSTVHTNSASATVTRLLDMGLEDYLLTSTIAGITAQRLVRSLCPVCREPVANPDAVLEPLIDELPADSPPPTVFAAAGCQACGMTGYSGRSAISEVLNFGEDIRRLVLKRAEAQDIHRAATEAGMRSLHEDGLRKVLKGITSLEEVMRVTQQT